MIRLSAFHYRNAVKPAHGTSKRRKTSAKPGDDGRTIPYHYCFRGVQQRAYPLPLPIEHTPHEVPKQTRRIKTGGGGGEPLQGLRTLDDAYLGITEPNKKGPIKTLLERAAGPVDPRCWGNQYGNRQLSTKSTKNPYAINQETAAPHTPIDTQRTTGPTSVLHVLFLHDLKKGETTTKQRRARGIRARTHAHIPATRHARRCRTKTRPWRLAWSCPRQRAARPKHLRRRPSPRTRSSSPTAPDTRTKPDKLGELHIVEPTLPTDRSIYQ